MNSILPGLASAPNVHPMLVHFPLALLPVALAVALLTLWRRHAFLDQMAQSLVYVGTLGAIVALATGYLATWSMGHEAPGHDLIHIHRNWMVATTILAVALSGFLFFTSRRPRTFTAAGIIGLACVVVTLILGADRGALLVFGYGVGTATQQQVSDSLEADEHSLEEHEH